MNKKKKNKVLIFVFIMFFIYIVLFMSEKAGFYEYKNYRRKEMTEAKIKEFENDIKNGENVNLNDYLSEEKKSYSSKVGDLGYNLSSIIEVIMSKGLSKTNGVISRLL